LVCDGREEFVVLLPNTSTKDAELVAEHLRLAVFENPIESDGHRVNVTNRVGVSTLKLDKDQLTAKLIKKSDQVLYDAKQAGRNIVIAYER
jgi:diguanylate cyclase (GGDEF)-like protein